MIGLTPVLALLVSASVAVPALEGYLRAAAEGRSGIVTGQAVGGPASPGGPDRSLGRLAVTLVPASPAVLDRLREVRERARDDLATYRRSAEAFAGVRRWYEQQLSEAGAGHLVRSTSTGQDGRFELRDVPAGAWLLLAEHAVRVDRTPRSGRAPGRAFRPQPRLVAYHAVTVWVREIAVEPGQMTAVQLTERNAWMTGIAEERRP